MIELLQLTVMHKPVWMWGAFLSVVMLLLAFDLGVLHRKDAEISVKQSLRLSLFYICMGLLFGVFVYAQLGPQSAQEYYTGFIIEKTLSLDNIFVISLVFSFFAIPRKLQYRVLFWGILGVIILRGLFIGLGAVVLQHFHWVLYLAGAFLIFKGISFLRGGDEEHDMSKNRVIRFFKKYLRCTDELHGNKFFIRKVDANSGKRAMFATPLFLALVVVEIVDLVFAVDSVPAIFAITTDEYIVYTSNIFAILGLRALYFALAAMLHRFAYLKYSLAMVLIFIGGKIFVPLVSDIEKVPSGISLAITLAILGAGIVYSLAKTKAAEKNARG